MRMRKPRLLSGSLCVALLGFAIISLPAAAQTTAPNEWTWMGGSDGNQEAPVYGTLGTPSAGNIPGSRYLAANWTDRSGNLWLFGGGLGVMGSNKSVFGDLWEFDPPTNEWAWMGGSSSANQPGVYGTQGKSAPSNIPGARDAAASWTDGAGHFWLFGGVGYDSADKAGVLNDLWEFDPSTMEWTWVSGSSTVSAWGGQAGVYGTLGVPATSNIPGGRQLTTVWIDKNGNFWFFGGLVLIEQGSLVGFNDLWEFNPYTTEWTWMGGSNTSCAYGVQSGVWGAMGTPAKENIPSCRFGASGWTDANGNFWLFGGEGRDIDGYWGDLSNIWEFNPSTNKWAWMGGTNIIDVPNGVPPGYYGTLGVPAAGNIPAGRRDATTWTDASGNFWLLGGLATGFEGDNQWSVLNDIWEFSPAANEWAWMAGSCSVSVGFGSAAVYGTLGVAGAANSPGGRWGGAEWTDRVGNLWLFGGEGADDLSDMWEYEPVAPAPKPSFAVVDLNNQALGNTQSFVVPAGTSGTTSVNTVVSDGFDGAITLSAVGLPSGITATFSPNSITGFGASQVTVSVDLDVAPGSYTFTVAGTSQGVTQTTSVSLTVASAPPPNFSLSISPTALTVTSGSQGTVTLTLTPEYGFNSAVTFTCSLNMPAGATCSFSPATVTPSGAAVSTTLTVSTSKTSAALRQNARPLFSAAALAGLLCCFSLKKRHRLQMLVLLAMSLAGLGLISACGGGGGSSGSGGGGGGGSQSATYTITVTATSGLVLHTTTFSLTVN
jgi:N-acetylneuraminic acid mutarotase